MNIAASASTVAGCFAEAFDDGVAQGTHTLVTEYAKKGEDAWAFCSGQEKLIGVALPFRHDNERDKHNELAMAMIVKSVLMSITTRLRYAASLCDQ